MILKWIRRVVYCDGLYRICLSIYIVYLYAYLYMEIYIYIYIYMRRLYVCSSPSFWSLVHVTHESLPESPRFPSRFSRCKILASRGCFATENEVVAVTSSQSPQSRMLLYGFHLEVATSSHEAEVDHGWSVEISKDPRLELRSYLGEEERWRAYACCFDNNLASVVHLDLTHMIRVVKRNFPYSPYKGGGKWSDFSMIICGKYHIHAKLAPERP